MIGKVFSVVLVAGLLGACSARDERAVAGGAIGAGAGALIGGLATGTGAGAAVGAVVGGTAGAVIGSSTTPNPRRRCWIGRDGYQYCRR